MQKVYMAEQRLIPPAESSEIAPAKSGLEPTPPSPVDPQEQNPTEVVSASAEGQQANQASATKQTEKPTQLFQPPQQKQALAQQDLTFFANQLSLLLEDEVISLELKKTIRTILGSSVFLEKIDLSFINSQPKNSNYHINMEQNNFAYGIKNACRELGIEINDVPYKELSFVLFHAEQCRKQHKNSTQLSQTIKDVTYAADRIGYVVQGNIEAGLYALEAYGEQASLGVSRLIRRLSFHSDDEAFFKVDEEKIAYKKKVQKQQTARAKSKRSYDLDKAAERKVNESCSKMEVLVQKNESVTVTNTIIDVRAGVIRSIGYAPIDNAEMGLRGTPVSWIIPVGRTETMRLALQNKSEGELNDLARAHIEKATDLMVSVHGYGANRMVMLPGVEQILLGDDHQALAWNDQQKVVGMTMSVMGSEHTMVDEKKFRYERTCDQVMETLSSFSNDISLFGKKLTFVGHSMGGQTVLRMAAKFKDGTYSDLADNTEFVAITPVVETKKHGHLKFFEGISGKILTTINTIPIDAVRNAFMEIGMQIGITQYLFDRLMLDPLDPNITVVRATHLREMKKNAPYLRSVTKELAAVSSLRADKEIMDKLRQMKDKIHFVVAGIFDHILENDDMINIMDELEVKQHEITGEGHYSTSAKEESHGLNIVRNVVFNH